MLTDRQTTALQSALSRGVPSTFQHTEAAGKPIGPDATRTFTADAASDLLTATAHGLAAGYKIRVTTTTTLPAPLAVATDYFVIASGLTANDFKLSATLGGSAINITTAGTGTHSFTRYLTTEERAEVDAYLAAMKSFSGPASDFPVPTLSGAMTMVADYQLHYLSPAYQNWWHDDQLAREAQYNLRRVDAHAASDATVPKSGDPAGAGSAPVTVPIGQAAATPTCDVPDPAVDSGTPGTTPVVVSLTCGTGGAAIHYRKNGGSWINYASPVTLAVSDVIDFYATKSGYFDSATGFFANV